MIRGLVVLLSLTSWAAGAAEAWRDCIPNSIGPGGCDSIGPGGGKSIGPGGGLSIGPGGGLSIGPGGGMSIGPGGGQSIAPGGGQSIAPGGGQALDRDRFRGLDPDTLRPYPQGGLHQVPAPIRDASSTQYDDGNVTKIDGAALSPDAPSAMPQAAHLAPPRAPDIDYSQFDTKLQDLEQASDSDTFARAYATSQAEAQRIVLVRSEFIARWIAFQFPNDPNLTTRTQQALRTDPELADVRQRLSSSTSVARRRLSTNQ